MIKVFLAEDELIIRRNFRENIDWKTEGFEFTGDAADGELALPLIISKKPDILITDIRMPFMDGLQLATMAKKELPDIKIILLSGYKDFNYAKEAISIGVEDYLLKPISSEKLLEKIKMVSKTIESKWEENELIEKYKAEMSEKKKLEKDRFFTELISGRYTYQELILKATSLGLELLAGNYAVFLLCIQSITNNSSETQECYVLQKTDIFPENWILFDRGIEGIAVLCKNLDNRIWMQFRTELSAKLENLSITNYFGVLGSTVERLSELHKSYLDAQKIFSTRFFHTVRNVLVRYTESYSVGNLSIPPEQNNEKIDLTVLEKFLKMGTLPEVQEYLKNLFSGFNYGSLRIPHFRQSLVTNVHICCSSFLQHLGYEKETLKSINENSILTFSEERIKPLIKELIEETLRLRDCRTRSRNAAIVSKAKEFIKKNFNSKDISLYVTAHETGISPNYLSTIFSTETNMTFIEYLTSMRLEKATELLINTNMRSNEISYEIGYQDAHYFSYIFKKKFGMTPKEYRTRKNNNKNEEE